MSGRMRRLVGWREAMVRVREEGLLRVKLSEDGGRFVRTAETWEGERSGLGFNWQ